MGLSGGKEVVETVGESFEDVNKISNREFYGFSLSSSMDFKKYIYFLFIIFFIFFLIGIVDLFLVLQWKQVIQVPRDEAI